MVPDGSQNAPKIDEESIPVGSRRPLDCKLVLGTLPNTISSPKLRPFWSRKACKIESGRVKNRSGIGSTSNLDTIDVYEQIFNEIMLIFEASAKAKTIQNIDDVVQKWTSRIYDFERYQ